MYHAGLLPFTGGHTITKRILIGLAQNVLGWMFVVLGILGIFLPLLQGILFIVIGLTILSSRYTFAQNLLKKAENRYPDEYAKMQGMHDRIMDSKPLLSTALVILVGLLSLGIYLAILGIQELNALE